VSLIQIHSDNSTEFVNKLNKELLKLLDIKHSTTTPGHPQCNAQAEVFYKTMAKYLALFVDQSTLDWEQYLTALQFLFNTSYHSTIAATPYELLYSMKPKTPLLPGQDIQRKFYGENTRSNMIKRQRTTTFQLANKYGIFRQNLSARTRNWRQNIAVRLQS